MRHATLIVNPAAGRATLLAAQLDAVKATLANHGYTTRIVATGTQSGATAALAMQAAVESSLVIACGGDGTIHDVVQGLVHTQATLGVIPLGTANALARNLGIPLHPVAAIERLLAGTACRIPLGQIESSTGTRYFIAMAGCGPDGMLAHSMSEPGIARLKARFGRSAYYAHALRLFLTRRWPKFQVEWQATDGEPWQTCTAVALMASRLPDLGGLFSGLTPGAMLTSERLHLNLLAAPAWLSMPAWVLCGRLGIPNPCLTTVDVKLVRCMGLGTQPIYAQADAEPLGALPIALRIVPNALSLLMPQ